MLKGGTEIDFAWWYIISFITAFLCEISTDVNSFCLAVDFAFLYLRIFLFINSKNC